MPGRFVRSRPGRITPTPLPIVAHRLSLGVVLLTFALITLGGVVHNTESSLACPDWPLCFGEVLPEMKGGVAIEHSHRLLATLVGMLTIWLVVLFHRGRRQDPVSARMAWIALALVVMQGLLGGITVLLKLPTLVSTGHLATSMLFFCLMVTLVCRTWPRFEGSTQTDPSLLRWVFVGMAAVYLQMLLGALVRHTGSGAAVGLGPDSILLGFDLSQGEKDLWPSDGPGQLHMAHRFAAAAVLVILLAVAHKVWYDARDRGDRPAQGLVLAALVLLAVQVFLGAASIWTFLSIPLVTAHLAVGAALLVDLLVLRLWLARVPPLSDSVHSPGANPAPSPGIDR